MDLPPELKRKTKNLEEYYFQWMNKYKWDLDEAQVTVDQQRDLLEHIYETMYDDLLEKYPQTLDRIEKELADE